MTAVNSNATINQKIQKIEQPTEALVFKPGAQLVLEDGAKLYSAGVDVTDNLAGGGGGGGLVLLDSAVITQVPNITLDLPAEYLSFKLVLNGLRCMESGEDSLNFRLSFDDGDTFPNDNYQYREIWGGVLGDHTVTYNGTDNGNTIELANGFPGQHVTTAGMSFCGELNIFPGSASLWATTYSSGVGILANDVDIKHMVGVGVYKIVGRATNIRLLVSTGVADFEAGGSYALFGIPNPA